MAKTTYYYASADGKTATKRRVKRTLTSGNRDVAYEAENRGKVLQISKEAYEKYYKGGKLAEGYKTGAMSEGTRKALGIKDFYSTGYRGATSPYMRGGGRGQGYSYPETFNRLNIFRDPNYVAPQPKPETVAAPASTISDEAKQFRADTMKILQQAEATRNQFMADQQKAAAVAAEREKAFAATAAARSANEARAGRAANLQIKQAEQQPTTMGTQAFKRRKNQFNVSGAYGGLSKISSGMVNL